MFFFFSKLYLIESFHLERLLTLRPFCERCGMNAIAKKYWNYLLKTEEWSEVEPIVRVLKWPYKLTQKLQAENLTLSDVYGHWTTMELKLRKETHSLAEILLRHLLPRRKAVLDNSAMVAAVYLDPRYNRLLDMDKRNEAVQFLQNLSTRVAALNSQNSGTEDEANEQDPVNRNEHHEFGNSSYLCDGVDEDLFALVQSNDERLTTSSSAKNSTTKKIESQLESFFKKETFTEVQNARGIFGYWSSAARYEYDALYEVAELLLSVPATQVSVERAFSSLRFILNDYRTSLGKDSLENILLIKLNFDM